MESSSRVREKVDSALEHFSLGADEKGWNTFTCVYCRQTYKGGGINRMKKHLAGIKCDIGLCKKVSHDVRYQMLEYVKEFELKKKAKKQCQEEMFSVPSTNSDMQEDEDVQEVFSSGLPKKLVLGKRKSTNPMDNYFAPRTTLGAQPGLKSVFQSKERVRQADMAIARFLYDNCIPFNVVNSVYYQRMIDAVAAAGPGYKDPSYHAVRVPLLRDQKKKDMGDMPHVERLKKHASKVTVFIYNHMALIAWLRKRPGWTDIVRVGATRFATTFLSFGSLHVHKHDLQALVTSKFFMDNRLARESKAKEVVSIILDNSFWDDINVLVKISSPLICLLLIVDSDQRPAIGYVYEGMHRAQLGIKKIFQMKKHLYKPYTSIIKNRWDKHL
ncbi:uncharacterized protein LOC126700698 [Quercus robur]|uniref:uncharacterized protein LOC126700698 n=1 Tax=Quercus robur TaxID=38942 RepID=UPI0021611489|nr:uncharacterized protein LOC126700698 [Quercus robur]